MYLWTWRPQVWNRRKDRIIEIGAAKIRDGEVQETYSLLVDPRIKIPERITDLTGINDQMVEGQPFVEEAVKGTAGILRRTASSGA